MHVFFGASGAARDIAFLLDSCLIESEKKFAPDYYIVPDNFPIDLSNGQKQISESEMISKLNLQWKYTDIQATIAIGSSVIREKIWKAYIGYSNISFPNYIDPSIIYDKRPGSITMGNGNLLLPGSTITTNIRLGNNNHININCTISHDCVLQDHITLSPGVHIAGNVLVKNTVFIGIGAVILENLTICENAIIGAGAVVTRSITEPGTYIGVPAKKIK